MCHETPFDEAVSATSSPLTDTGLEIATGKVISNLIAFKLHFSGWYFEAC